MILSRYNTIFKTKTGIIMGTEVFVMNPDSEYRTDLLPLIEDSDIGVSDGVWKNQYLKINTKGFKELTLNLTVTNTGTSTGLKCRIISSDVSDGEFTLNATDYEKDITTPSGSDIKESFQFQVESLNYVIVQTSATTLGTARDVTIEYSLK